MIVRAALVLLTVSVLANGAALWAHADLWIIPALLVGWALADLVSGLGHMLFDYMPCPKELELDRIYFYQGSRNSDEYKQLKARLMQRAGPFYRIVFDFKTHHPRAGALGRRSFVQLTQGTILYGALPLSLGMNLLSFMSPRPGWLLAMAVAFIVGLALTQYFHSSLHRPDVPAAILLMRRMRLLMTPAAHSMHHDTLRRDFAIINGWTNPLLNPVFDALHRRGVLSDEALEPPRLNPSG